MAVDKKYTPIGSTVTRWARLREVSVVARWVWMALYTGSEAKMCPPGLFFGSIYSVANAAGMTLQEADKAMHELVTARLVLWDVANELVRLVELPDNLSRAHTEQAIHGWWGRFCNLPPCALRDSHVPQLGAMVMAGKVNDKMRRVWEETFGTILVPGSLPLLPSPSSSDTSTPVQPSLFGAERGSVPSSSKNENPIKSGTVVLAPRTGSGTGSGSGSSGEEEPRSVQTRDTKLVVGPWKGSASHYHQLAEPTSPAVRARGPTPPDCDAEARNAHAEEMRKLVAETAGAIGADWLVPKQEKT